jgi:hypothetical protein
MSQPTVDRLTARREEIITEIARMPLSKDGSAWHNDRIAELKRIARLLSR